MRHRILLACLIVSGGCGLAWELLWTRLLTLSYGSTTLSFSTVLAVYFGGLALGSWVGGRRAAGLARPIAAYGWIEIATGALGLVLYPVLLSYGSLFAAIDPGGGLAGGAIRVLATTPVLLAPTFLMGATLPLVAAGSIRTDEAVGRGAALIYGFNTLGAFAGTYLVTYHLLYQLGVFQTVLVTALANFAVGGVAVWIGHHEAPREPGPSETEQVSVLAGPEAGERRRDVVQLAAGLTFVSGFAFISLELVWTRLFASLLGGTIYSLGAVLICFLVGIGLGSLAVARLLHDARRVGLWFALAQLLALLGIILLFRNLTFLAWALQQLGMQPGARQQHLQLLVVFTVLAIPTLCSGASFPMLVRVVEWRARGTSRALGSLLASNTLGSILGSLITGFVLIPAVGSVGAVVLALALLALSAALSGALLTEGRPRIAGAAAALVAVLAVAGFPGFDAKVLALAPFVETYEAYRVRHTNSLATLVYFAEGRDATVAVHDQDGTRGLLLNGQGQGSLSRYPPIYTLESALLAAIPLRHAEPRDALVVGLGAGVTVDVLARMGVPEVTVVEIEPRVVDAVDVIYRDHSPVDRDNVHAVLDDARHFLLVEEHRGAPRHSVIMSMPSHPWIAPNIFTREFFELCRGRLRPEGLFATWFSAQIDGPTVESLFRAFTGVFPNYAVYYVREVGAYYLVGSAAPLRLDSERLAEVHSHPALEGLPLMADPSALTSLIVGWGDPATPPPPPGLVNTDDSVAVETRSSRPTQASSELKGFLAREHFDPGVVPEEERRRATLDVIERLLGTPDARLSVGASHPDARRAELLVAAAGTLLTAQEQAFHGGRAAALSGDDEEGLRLLEQAAGGEDPELATRALVHRAMLRPWDSETQRAALLATPPHRDAALTLLEIGAEGWREQVPSAPAGPDDPALWLLQHASDRRALDAAERDAFAQTVGPAMLESSRLGLISLARSLAVREGMGYMANSLELHGSERARQAAESFEGQALQALRAGDLAGGVALLERADASRPGSERTLRRLLQGLLILGEDEAAARVEERLRAIGRSESWLEAVRQAARDEALAPGPDPAEPLADQAGEPAAEP